MSFDVAPQQDCTPNKRRSNGRSRGADQGEVRSRVCADRGRTVPHQNDQEREGLIRLVMEGHCAASSAATVEEIVKQPEMVSDRMRGTCAEDMNKMGWK